MTKETPLKPLKSLQRDADNDVVTSAERRQEGFTLVELLVVIAVMTLLAGLLLPTFSSARFQARSTSCKNNLRQIAVAVHLYTSDHGVYPPQILYADENRESYFDWDQLLERTLFPARTIRPVMVRSGLVFYSRTPFQKPFLCPFLVSTWPQDNRVNPYPQGSRYNYNQYGITGYSSPRPWLGLCGPTGYPSAWELPRGQPESAVVAPSEMIAFGDPFSRSLNRAADGFHRMSDWRPFPDVSPQIPPVPGYARRAAEGAKNHRRRFNKVFCDGHVESENYNKPFVASDEYLRQWNNDHQPHRDLWHPI